MSDGWQEDLSPIGASDWTPQRARHLLDRAGFGGPPEEVARLVLFLAADDSAAITNQCHVIDGGWV